MNLERALQIEGFTVEKELRWLGERAANAFNIVEIGSWHGRSMRVMADNAPIGAKLTAVDTWNGTKNEHEPWLEGKPSNWLFDDFVANMLGATNRVLPWRMTSLQAAKLATQLGRTYDLIFIDGDHSYHAVAADIKAWRPLLAPGGLFCGHDFDGGRPGVVRAVKEFVPTVRAAFAGSIWYED